MLIGEGTVVGGFNGVVDGAVRVDEGLIVGHCPIRIVEVNYVIDDSTVVSSDVIADITIVRVHNVV